MPADGHRCRNDHSFGQCHQRDSPQVIHTGNQQLKPPMEIDPGFIGVSKGIQIDVRDSVSRQDPLTRFQMPPEVGVREGNTEPEKRPEQ